MYLKFLQEAGTKLNNASRRQFLLGFYRGEFRSGNFAMEIAQMTLLARREGPLLGERDDRRGHGVWWRSRREKDARSRLSPVDDQSLSARNGQAGNARETGGPRDVVRALSLGSLASLCNRPVEGQPACTVCDSNYAPQAEERIAARQGRAARRGVYARTVAATVAAGERGRGQWERGQETEGTNADETGEAPLD